MRACPLRVLFGTLVFLSFLTQGWTGPPYFFDPKIFAAEATRQLNVVCNPEGTILFQEFYESEMPGVSPEAGLFRDISRVFYVTPRIVRLDEETYRLSYFKDFEGKSGMALVRETSKGVEVFADPYIQAELKPKLDKGKVDGLKKKFLELTGIQVDWEAKESFIGIALKGFFNTVRVTDFLNSEMSLFAKLQLRAPQYRSNSVPVLARPVMLAADGRPVDLRDFYSDDLQGLIVKTFHWPPPGWGPCDVPLLQTSY